MEVIFIVLIFSIVQSIFGVGLLLFGTPTLLLLGVGYEQVLWILLPSSITISLYQVFENKIQNYRTYGMPSRADCFYDTLMNYLQVK